MVSPIYNLPTLDFVAGETQSFRFHLLTAANSPYDANACDVAFAIINYTNKTGTPLIVKMFLSPSERVVSQMSQVLNFYQTTPSTFMGATCISCRYGMHLEKQKSRGWAS